MRDQEENSGEKNGMPEHWAHYQIVVERKNERENVVLARWRFVWHVKRSVFGRVCARACVDAVRASAPARMSVY